MCIPVQTLHGFGSMPTCWYSHGLVSECIFMSWISCHQKECVHILSLSPSCYLVAYCDSVHFCRISMRVLCLALFSFTWSICSLRMPAAAGSVYSLSSGVCFALVAVGFYNFSMYECMSVFIYLIIYLCFLLC